MPAPQSLDTAPLDRARDLLRRTWIRQPELDVGDLLIYKAPVDPVGIADAMSVEVFGTKLPEGIYGKVIKRSGVGPLHPNSGGEPSNPIIYLNLEASHEVRRFTCAHEIGHVLDPGVSAYQLVDYDGTISSGATEEHEAWANRFAAALLMPTDNVLLLRRRNKSVLEMAQAFGVTGDAVNLRLREFDVS